MSILGLPAPAAGVLKEVPDITRDSETYFLLTSLTSGQSAIITATSRLELLLITMKVPFVAVDVATDEKARLLWKRRGNGKRLPVVVHDGVVLGNFEDMEQANEWGELKQTLGIAPPPRPPSLARSASISSVASVSTTASKKPSAHPLPSSDPVPTTQITVPIMQAAAQAAALAAQRRQSGILSSSASIKSDRSFASTVKQPAPEEEEPSAHVEVPAPKVEEPAPTVEQPAPTVEQPAPKGEEIVLKIEEPIPEVKEEIPVPKVKEPKAATSSMRNRAPVPAAARRNFAAPMAKTVAERAIRATGRASIDEKRIPTSRPGSRASARPESRASDIRPESRISVRPDSKRMTITGQEKKAPSITARSVKSVSSASTVKPTDRGNKASKKEKSKIDKLKKKEVK
ncbi:hypothetical protein L211DRAFT_846403 [Terfezia boudieri ATCC MYA-4762]|uniref:Uncharacterized protein n=1 Tax=Terfezia boudieri ATCC MYA-4762 TaxID=1051890 RepID=A0A3N4M151_9PEZI|nr:hypothetical protein L211DRAFT_846403 [Terfezia boudieri ATCC MYA-4762]